MLILHSEALLLTAVDHRKIARNDRQTADDGPSRLRLKGSIGVEVGTSRHRANGNGAG